jgi:ABC-2 type transport system permease protein
MKQFIAFVKKEFYHIFRDRRTMLILLGMPVVEIILFGFAISTEVKNVRLAVLDPSNDVVTRKIIDRLDASEYFTVTTRFHSPQEMEAAFRKNKIDMAIVFGERFADGLYTGDARVQLIVDATDPNMSTSQSNYAASIVSSAGQEMLPPNVSVSRLTPDVKLLYNPQMKSAYNFVPGVMGLILMLICAMMTSISIVREKETGTMEVLLVSPVKPLFIVLAKAVPYFVLSFVNLTTIFSLCTGCAGSGEFVLAGDSVFALYFRVAGFGLTDFFRDKYTGGGHAGIRNDIDDAHHGFVRNDFSGRKYAGDSPGHIGHYSRPLVYSGCTQTDD